MLIKIGKNNTVNSALNYCQGFFVAARVIAGIFYLLILLTLFGCQTIRASPQEFHRSIPPLGASYETVRNIYGRPDCGNNVRMRGRLFSVWEYKIGSYSVIFYFENGILTGVVEG